MNKSELVSLANIGKTEIEGIPLEVIVKPSSMDGTDWIEIHVEPFSALHPPLILGQKWLEHVTDAECAELPAMLLKYKAEADAFCERAKTVVRATSNGDITYTFTDVPDDLVEVYKKEFAQDSSILTGWLKGRHVIRFVNENKTEWYAPDVFAIELDGIRYLPHWSYLLERVYYVVDDNIRKIMQV